MSHVRKKVEPAKPPKTKVGGARPGAGRPPTVTAEERDAIQRARAAGRAAMPGLVNLMLRIALDSTADRHSRIRAAEFVANRCGMPPEQRVTTETEGTAILALVAKLDQLADDAPEP